MEQRISKIPTNGKGDLPLIALNLLLVFVTAGALFFADAHFRRSAQSAALKDNVFLTTEWRLLKEMKARTDRLLQDKDREITDLRRRYETLRRESPSSELLTDLADQLRRAESEREGILTARYQPAPPLGFTAQPVPAAAQAADTTAEIRPADSSRLADTPVTELLRDKIQSLQEEIATDRQDMVLLQKKVGDLREQLTKADSDPDVREDFSPDAPILDLNAVLGILKEGRDALPEEGPTLSLTDLKTRSLLRAIVRTPAIHSEYPELSDSLDRYFDLYGSSERLKGKREAYDEIIEAVGAQQSR